MAGEFIEKNIVNAATDMKKQTRVIIVVGSFEWHAVHIHTQPGNTNMFEVMDLAQTL